MYQNVTEGQLSISSEFYYLEIGFYASFTDIVEAMNSHSRKTQTQRKLYHS